MLSELVQEIATRIEARESRTRSRTASNQTRFLFSIEYILTDLWKSAYTIPPNRKCRIHLNKNYYASQYAPKELGYEPTLDAFQGMSALGLIDHKLYLKIKLLVALILSYCLKMLMVLSS